MTHRTLLKGIGWEWILRDVGVPLAISLIIGALGKMMVLNGAWSGWEKASLACLLLLSGWMLPVLLAPRPMFAQAFHFLNLRKK
jgi:hypothetical protein